MDSDQYKLSCWWHNEYNNGWYVLDCLREVISTGTQVTFSKDKEYFNCAILDKPKAFYGARKEFLEAFLEAYNAWKFEK